MNRKQIGSITAKVQRKARKVDYEKLGTEAGNNKVRGIMKRFLSKDLKKNFKPLLVIYLTHQTQREVQRSGGAFLKTIEQRCGNKFFIMVLPALSEQEVRAELWCKGKLLSVGKPETGQFQAVKEAIKCYQRQINNLR